MSSLVVDTADAPKKPADAITQIFSPQYKGVTVDTRYVPSSALMTQIEGSPWILKEYFSQVVDTDNQVAGQRMNSSAIYQSYRCIKGLELRVTSPLTKTQTPETNGFDVTGAANSFPFLIPNVGDMFRVDIGDGQLGVFQITRSEQMSYFKEACYQCEYKLIDYATPERMADLFSKTIQTYVYVSDFLMHGQNPLLFEEDFALVQDLAEHLDFITRDWFRTFWEVEFHTLLLPGQEFSVYDHFVVQMMLKSCTTFDAEQIRHVRVMNLDDDRNMETVQFWEMLFKQQPKLLQQCADRMGLAGARSFSRNPMLEGIYHTGIDYVVYPKNPVLAVNYGTRGSLIPLAPVEIQEAPSQTRRLKDTLVTVDLPGLPVSYGSAPLIHPVKCDDYYVLSQAFYDEAPGQSLLELCVGDYLHRRNIPVRALIKFCEHYRSWGGLEFFYYVPILLTLIKANIRSM